MTATGRNATTPSSAVRQCLDARTWLFRHTGIFGKDVLQYARIPAVIGALLLLIVLGSGVADAVLNTGSVTTSDAGDFFRFGLLAVAFVLGVAMAGEEEEDGTRIFLGRLPAGALQLLLPRLAAAALLWAVWFVVAGSAIALSVGIFPPKFIADAIAEPGVYLFGESGLLFTIALFLTGFAATSWITRNVVLAAAVGGIAQILYWLSFLLFIALFIKDEPLRWNSLIRVDVRAYSFHAHVSWSMLMAAALAWRYHTWTEGAPTFWESFFDKPSSLQGGSAGEGRSLRLDPSRVLIPHTIGWAIALAIGSFTLAREMNKIAQNDLEVFGPQLALMLTLASAFLGAAALHRGEREPGTFFLGGLPVPPRAFLNARLRRLAAAAVALSVVTLLACALGGAMSPKMSDVFVRQISLVLIGTVSVAFLGFWARYFQRSLLIAGLMASVLGFVWMMAAWLLFFSLNSGIAYTLPERVEHVVWPLAVMLGVPFALIHVTARGSLVPELNERPRNVVYLFVSTLALIWGPALITFSPLDALVLLFN
ncbi:MAG: hypothetical protein PWP23_2503 [Candidatus Sumerlaeota bacterium]|nr:hypothetical protein [Candidatus Sumerlaeota bacterium]